MEKHILIRIPVSNTERLLYAPTLGKLWRVKIDDDLGMEVVKSQQPIVVPRPHLDLTFLISFKCTLDCTYCYEGHKSSETLSFETAREFANDLMSAHKGTVERIVGNYFGGEPTLHMDFMRRMSDWMRWWGKANGEKVIMCVTTNANYHPDLADELWAVVDKVKVSTDGLKDLQDSQRPTVNGKGSHDRVMAVIDRLVALRPKGVSLRITVTTAALERMREICEYLCSRFPGVRQQYEPAMDSPFARGGTTGYSFGNFVDGYLGALVIGDKHHTPVTTSFARLSKYGGDVNRFCGVASSKYTMLPNGDIASCNRVHTSTVRSSPFFLGVYPEKIKERPVYRLPQMCETCYARYNCKGGCYALRHSLGISVEQGFPFCEDIRRLVREALKYRLKRRKEVRSDESL